MTGMHYAATYALCSDRPAATRLSRDQRFSKKYISLLLFGCVKLNGLPSLRLHDKVFFFHFYLSLSLSLSLALLLLLMVAWELVIKILPVFRVHIADLIRQAFLV